MKPPCIDSHGIVQSVSRDCLSSGICSPRSGRMHGHLRSLLGRSLRQHVENRARQAQWKARLWHAKISDLGPCACHRAYVAASMWRHSHAKPHQVPPAQRDRAMMRPAETYTSATGRSKSRTKNKLYFIAAPTDPMRDNSPQRDPKLSHRRAQMKNCATANSLLKRLSEAFDKGEVDGSVIGAAMQTCGHNRWWETLMQVHDQTVKYNVACDAIERRIFINAMAACLQRSQCSDVELSARKDRALRLSKQAWLHMSSPSKELDFRCALGAAWRVCAEIGEPALPWADELLNWCNAQKKYTATAVQYSPFWSLLERCKHQDRVEELLAETVQRRGCLLDQVTLGSLINAAGNDNNYQPNMLCFTARSKAHFLAGRPASAAKILEGMQVDDGPRAVAMHLQARLVVCHAEMTIKSKRKLRKCLADAETVDTSEDSRQIKSELAQLIELSQKLLREPSSLRLPDLLVMHFARNGRMGDWPRHKAGSNYLPKDEC